MNISARPPMNSLMVMIHICSLLVSTNRSVKRPAALSSFMYDRTRRICWKCVGSVLNPAMNKCIVRRHCMNFVLSLSNISIMDFPSPAPPVSFGVAERVSSVGRNMLCGMFTRGRGRGWYPPLLEDEEGLDGELDGAVLLNDDILGVWCGWSRGGIAAKDG